MPYADPEKKREHDQRYYAMNREVTLARVAAWTRENPNRRKAIVQRYRDRHEDEMREYAKDWYKRHREEVLARTAERTARLRSTDLATFRMQANDRAARRRARIRSALVETVDYAAVWERDEGICGICGCAADPSDWHLDHINPIARGGEHSYANVQVSHPACNRRKAAS